MAVHYSTDFIDKLLQQVDMAEIMDKHGIPVKYGSQANNYYVASFCCGKTDMDNGRIKKETQTYKCLACGGGGNALHFMQQVAGKTFPESVVYLANLYGVELPIEDPSLKEARIRKEQALKLAADFYAGQNNLNYMLERGISEEVLKQHGVGYAPGGRALRTHLEDHGYIKQELLDYKLINHKGLDALFYRAVVPVVMRGKVTDLYGRAVDDTKAGIKHFYLYGDDILGGFDGINPKRVVMLYESAINRLAAETHGIDNGVDSGGALKFTAAHARQLLKKGVTKVMIVYDGDAAGRKGALRTGELCDRAGMQVWIGELPEKQDPAKMLLEEGKDAYVTALYKPKTYKQFKLYQELDNYDLADIENYIADRKSNKG